MARKKKRDQDDPAGFAERPQVAGRSRLSPVEIQQKVFRLAFRGYNERDVDEFLDHVTEDLAALHEENKRLREQLGGGGGGGEDLSAARGQAEAIVREAREHAARLIEDTGPAAAGGGGLSATFLLRERDFLQRMAQSVQEHARWLKEEAQRQRAAGGVAAAVPVKTEKPTAGKKSRASAAKKGATKASAGEATAAWGPPQEGMAEPESGWSQERAAGEPDPLLSAWESAFTGEASEGPPAEGATGTKSKEGEPSLKELFWGEE